MKYAIQLSDIYPNLTNCCSLCSNINLLYAFSAYTDKIIFSFLHHSVHEYNKMKYTILYIQSEPRP